MTVHPTSPASRHLSQLLNERSSAPRGLGAGISRETHSAPMRHTVSGVAPGLSTKRNDTVGETVDAYRTAPRGATSTTATPLAYSTTSRSPCLQRSTPESTANVETTWSMISSSLLASRCSYVTSMLSPLMSRTRSTMPSMLPHTRRASPLLGCSSSRYGVAAPTRRSMRDAGVWFRGSSLALLAPQPTGRRGYNVWIRSGRTTREKASLASSWLTPWACSSGSSAR